MTNNSELSSLGLLDLIVISTNLDGQVTVFNSVAEEALGYDSHEVVGEEIPIQDFSSYKTSILQETNGGNLANFRHKNGTNINLELNTSSIRDKSGSVTGLLFTATKPLRLAITSCAKDLPNMQVLDIVLERECARQARVNQDLSILKLDIDFFRAYRAKYGDKLAQACLDNIAHTLQDRVKRAGDLLTYSGKDEFFVLLPNTDRSGAVTVAEHLRLLVSGLEIENTASKIGTGVTISVGIFIVFLMIKPKTYLTCRCRRSSTKS